MTKSSALRGSRTKAARAKAIEFAVREAKTKAWMKASQEAANNARSKEREFHGLEREFVGYQSEMLADFEKSKHIHHPRDKGNVREQILRKFLTERGLLPSRIGVSNTSVRVASTTGHVSNELDIVLYDAFESIALMRREGLYEVLPVESAYCAIQVKSRLNKTEIKDAIANIASFKKLDPVQRTPSPRSGQSSSRPFGFVFAYDSDLDWSELVSAIMEASLLQAPHLRCNGIFILSKGHFFLGSKTKALLSNEELCLEGEQQIFGYPDRQNDVLYSFYTTLLHQLRRTQVSAPPVEQYYRLPSVAGNISYEFVYGHLFELMTCPAHGPFAKRFEAETLRRIVDWCATAEKISWGTIINLANGEAGEDDVSHSGQYSEIVVYNPDNLPFPTILLHDSEVAQADGTMLKTKGMGLDHLRIVDQDLYIFLPHYYVMRELLYLPCARCKSWDGMAKSAERVKSVR